jgi:hypothetical protein
LLPVKWQLDVSHAGVTRGGPVEKWTWAILRRAWLNLDQVWAVALVGAGTATLLTA